MKQSLLSSWCGVTTTLAKTVGSPSAHRRGTMLKHVAFLLLFLFAGFGNVWGDTNMPTSGQSYRFKAVIASGTGAGTYYLVAPTSSGAGGTTTTESNGTIFTFTKESNKWYVTFVSGTTTYYMYGHSTNGSVSVSTTKTECTTVTTNGDYCKVGGTKWIQFNYNNGNYKYGCYTSATGCVLAEASSCSPLSMTTVTATPGNGQIALSWPAVTNASSYTVSCKVKSSGAAAGTAGSVTGTTTKSCTITGLSNGVEYTWSVEPVGSGTYCSSNTPATGDATPNQTRTITYYDKDGSHTTSLVDGANIATALNALYGVGGPTSCNTEDYEYFVGWKDGNISGTASSVTLLSTEVVNATNAEKTFYAVWSDKDPSSGSWAQTTTVAVGDHVVIAQIDDGTKEMTGFNTTVTTANNYGTGAAFTTSPAGTMVWTVEAGNSEGSFAFKNSSNYYLRAPSTNNNYLYGSDTKDNYASWTITTSSSRAQVTNVGASTRVIMWNKNNTRFSTYTGKSHGNNSGQYYYYVIFYKQSAVSAKYITTCCTSLAPINGSVNMSQLDTPAEGKLKASWQLAATTGIGSLTLQLWKKGSSDAQVGDNIDVSEQISTSIETYTFEGLDHCETYYAKLIAAKDEGTYCTDGWTETSGEATTLGYAITISDADGEVYDGSDLMGVYGADKANACSGETVTLTALNETGYHFASWSVTKTNGGTAVAMTGDNTFTMPAEAVTIAATFESDATPIGITFTPNANATLSATVGGNTATEAYAGETVTLACTDITSGYQFVGWIVTAGGEPVSVTNNTFTMPSSAVTVAADVRQTVTVTFKRDGSVYDTQSTYSGGTVTFPSNPSKFDNDYPNFIGWADAISGIATSAPTLKSASDAITANAEYHAVFANAPQPVNSYEKVTTTGDMVNNCKYVIAAWDAAESKYYAATGAMSGYYLNKVDVTSKFAEDVISAPDNSEVWKATVADSKVQFQNVGNSKYLNVVVSVNNNKTYTNFELTDNSGEEYSYAVSTGAWTFTTSSLTDNKQIEYYDDSGKDYFSYYTAQDAPIYLFKQQSACTEWVTRAVVKHTISYDANTEDSYTGTLPDAVSVVDGEDYTVSDAVLSERAGYNFIGWNEDDEATSAQTTLTNVTDDVTLYAVWEIIPTYDIEFSVNGAPVAALKIDDILQGTAITFPDAAAITAASAFPATDKKFMGWIEATSYASDIAPTFVTSATAAADKTYYAVFADVIGDDVVDEYDNSLDFPFALWEKVNNRGQKSDGEAWQMYGDKGGNAEGEIKTATSYSNLVSLGFNAKTGSNNTTLTIYHSADEETWTQLTTKAISQNTTYSDYSIDLSAIPSGAKYIKVKNSTNSFFIKSITLTQGAVSDYVTNISPLSSIAITTAPTKTAYKKGQMLDLTSMVVTATYENERTRAVTNYTVTPNTTTALATTDVSFTVSYTEGEITRTDDQEIHVYELSGIAITNPTKTTYNAGETFDPAGMTVTATWGGSALDKIAETVDSYTYSPNTAFVNETDEDINVDVTISYTHEGVTKTATQVVTVHPLANLTMTWNVAGETSTSKIYINNQGEYLLVLPSDPEVPEAFGTGYEFIGWTSDATIAKNGQGINWAASNDEMTIATEFKAVFAQANTPFFKETFDDCDGTGGNDDSWSGNIASSTFRADNTWSTVSAYGGDRCVRIGTSSAQGSVTTSTFSMTGSGKLVFKAGAYDGDQTTLNLSATGATLASSSVTLQNAAWDDYEIAITNATGSVTITFQGKQANKARFFLDEVEVKNGDAEYSNYRFVPSSVTVPVITLAEATYYGAQNVTITQAQDKQIFYSLDGNTWTEYTAPVALDQAGDVTLSAKAYDEEQDDYSSVVSKSYTIVTEIDAPTMTASCVFVDDQTVTISHDMSGTEGFALEYSYDGENYTAYTEALTVTETTTIYAKATIGSLEATANATYTKGHPVDYTKVTSAAGLAIGQQFIIKAVGVNAAAGALGSDVLAAVDIPEEVSNTITLINEPVTVFELGGRSGAYTLISDSKYLKYKGNKTLEYSATADTWTITYSDGTPTIKNVTNSSYSLQYNSSSPRFTVYTSAQTAVAIYAKAATVYTLTVKDYDGSNMLTEKVVEGGSFILTEADEPSDAESGYEFLNKWTDGTNTYAIGDAVEVSANMTLNPCWKVTPTDAVIDIDGLPEGVKEIVVGEGKDLNVNDDKTYDNVTVEAGGKISGSSELTVNNLTVNTQSGKSGQVTGSNVNVNGDIYLEIKLDASGTMDPHKWYCISAPFAVSAFEWGNGTPMVFNVDYQLFEYQGDKRARTGNGWQRVGGTMKANTAYFIGFDDTNANNQNVIKLKANSNTIPTAASMHLDGHSSEIEGSNDWYGLGNPALHYVGVNKTAHVFGYEVQGYDVVPSWSTDFTGFVVGTAFFVQANDFDLTFNNSATAYHAPKRQAEEYTYCVEINREGASHYDNRIFVRASEDAEPEFVQGKDEYTLNGTSSNYGALLWTENYGGKRLAIEEAPLVDEKATYELGIFAPAAGAYSISVASARENADLYLTYEGSIIWNLSEGEYTADLAKGSNTGYGLLLVKKVPMMPTGIDEVQGNKVQCTKVILDEKVFILRGGQMYDVTGKAVR